MEEDDITQALVQIAATLKLYTECQQQTQKQIADLRLEIAALKFGQDRDAK